jgi:hypothetical protein
MGLAPAGMGIPRAELLQIRGPAQSLATIDRGLAPLAARSGEIGRAKYSGMEGSRSKLMYLKTLLAERRELIFNWLALLALLAVGVVWPPV